MLNAFNAYFIFIKFFLKIDSIKFINKYFNGKTAFYYAVEEGYIEIVKLLLTNNKVDINLLNI